MVSNVNKSEENLRSVGSPFSNRERCFWKYWLFDFLVFSKCLIFAKFHRSCYCFIIKFGLCFRYGRRLILTWCLFQIAVADTCAAFAPAFFVYCILRFLSGMSTIGVLANNSMLSKSTSWILDIFQVFSVIFHLCLKPKFSLCFVSVMEWTVPRYQAMGMIFVVSAGSIGQIILGGLAFAIRNWCTLQLVMSVPLFVLFIISRYELHFSHCLMGPWTENVPKIKTVDSIQP